MFVAQFNIMFVYYNTFFGYFNYHIAYTLQSDGVLIFEGSNLPVLVLVFIATEFLNVLVILL